MIFSGMKLFYMNSFIPEKKIYKVELKIPLIDPMS